MGGNFSSRKDVYVHQFVNPRIQEHQEQVMVRMMAVPGENALLSLNGKREMNPFKHLISDKDEGQQAIIMGLYVLFINNETKHDITLELSGLFNAPAEALNNQDVQHTDDSGRLQILCPAGFNKAVEGNDRILYKPRLKDDVIRAYAGLDTAILKDHSIALNEKDDESIVLEMTHPMVHFIITNTELLKPESSDVVKRERFLDIKPDFFNKARQYYADTIHNDMHMTRFEETKLACAPPRDVLDDIQNKKDPTALPNVTCILQLNYLIVTPGEPKMRHQEIKV
jgi:hypothetical protein